MKCEYHEGPKAAEAFERLGEGFVSGSEVLSEKQWPALQLATSLRLLCIASLRLLCIVRGLVPTKDTEQDQIGRESAARPRPWLRAGPRCA